MHRRGDCLHRRTFTRHTWPYRSLLEAADIHHHCKQVWQCRIRVRYSCANDSSGGGPDCFPNTRFAEIGARGRIRRANRLVRRATRHRLQHPQVHGLASRSRTGEVRVARGQIAGRIARELALYEPHVVNFSESPDEKLTREIAERLGMHHVRFPSGGDWPGTLLSKFEVLESQMRPSRAVLDRPSCYAPLGTSRAQAPVRPTAHRAFGAFRIPSRIRRFVCEIDAMLEAMQSDLKAGGSLILMGDLNHTPDSPEYPKWREAGLVDTFAAVGANAALPANPDGKTFAADEPRVRIDYVWCAGPLARNIKSSRSLWDGAFRTNSVDDQSFALSDHVPQFAAFSVTD